MKTVVALATSLRPWTPPDGADAVGDDLLLFGLAIAMEREKQAARGLA